MPGETKEVTHKSLDGWLIGHIEQPDELIPEILVIRGFVEGKFTKFAPVFFLDLKDKIVMTDKDVYKMGEPNQQWIKNFLAAGNCIHDIEMSDIFH